jgi:hypothetical protein
MNSDGLEIAERQAATDTGIYSYVNSAGEVVTKPYLTNYSRQERQQIQNAAVKAHFDKLESEAEWHASYEAMNEKRDVAKGKVNTAKLMSMYRNEEHEKIRAWVKNDKNVVGVDDAFIRVMLGGAITKIEAQESEHNTIALHRNMATLLGHDNTWAAMDLLEDPEATAGVSPRDIADMMDNLLAARKKLPANVVELFDITMNRLKPTLGLGVLSNDYPVKLGKVKMLVRSQVLYELEQRAADVKSFEMNPYETSLEISDAEAEWIIETAAARFFKTHAQSVLSSGQRNMPAISAYVLQSTTPNSYDDLTEYDFEQILMEHTRVGIRNQMTGNKLWIDNHQQLQAMRHSAGLIEASEGRHQKLGIASVQEKERFRSSQALPSEQGLTVGSTASTLSYAPSPPTGIGMDSALFSILDRNVGEMEKLAAEAEYLNISVPDLIRHRGLDPNAFLGSVVASAGPGASATARFRAEIEARQAKRSTKPKVRFDPEAEKRAAEAALKAKNEALEKAAKENEPGALSKAFSEKLGQIESETRSVVDMFNVGPAMNEFLERPTGAVNAKSVAFEAAKVSARREARKAELERQARPLLKRMSDEGLDYTDGNLRKEWDKLSDKEKAHYKHYTLWLIAMRADYDAWSKGRMQLLDRF